MLTQLSNAQCLEINVWMRPLLAVVPSLWRHLQCWRRFFDKNGDWWQLANALKYGAAFFVTTFSILRVQNPETPAFDVLWMLAIGASTLYRCASRHAQPFARSNSPPECETHAARGGTFTKIGACCIVTATASARSCRSTARSSIRATTFTCAA